MKWVERGKEAARNRDKRERNDGEKGRPGGKQASEETMHTAKMTKTE